jgi:hypothetical protein
MVDHGGDGLIKLAPNPDTGRDPVGAASYDVLDPLFVMNDAKIVRAHPVLATGVGVGLFEDLFD